MSKMDDMRAMREARYEANKAGAAKRTAAPKAQRPAPSRPEAAERVEAVAEAPQEGLCGHRAISGKTCTREKGHAAKSHRYS